MEWIKVKDKLPGIGKPIILTIKATDGTRYVDIGYIDASNNIHVGSHDVTDSAIAWMALPEPYEF